MKITDHRFEGVTFKRAKSHSGRMIEPPQVMVLHYGAGTQESDIAMLTRGYVSAHLSIGRSGKIVQLLPFDHVAWHAGDGHMPIPYHGRTLNYTALGIEMENFGWLNKWSRTQAWREEAWQGKTVKTPKVPLSECIGPLSHPLRGGQAMYWPTYPEMQLGAVWQALAAIFDAYPSIKYLVGHDEVSARKFDPGPAFDLDVWRAVFGKQGMPALAAAA